MDDMKAIAFNSSPRMDKGNTAKILDPFLEGMKEEGADVELYYPAKLKIKPCQGELHCWLKHPGRCFQKDDMNDLYPKLHAADIVVLATPVYVDGMSGLMKMLMDRMVPLVQPFIELRDGHCRHTVRSEHKPHGKVVLVSNCGFWEMDNFDPLIVHVKAACRNMAREFSGALLRPHGAAMRIMLEMGIPIDDVVEAARQAGRQLVRTGRMSEETLATISRELMPMETYVAGANQFFQAEIERNRSE
jgi:multimeric flavodoxin WrbA